ncbi:hypothetical protein GCM10009811_23680 [Nostocoides veronense]|uniref:Uncharacterized protein n=1 Tax=Nostocoides veronense TaxID=330836 RepID=A0ABN2LTK4_9MICO
MGPGGAEPARSRSGARRLPPRLTASLGESGAQAPVDVFTHHPRGVLGATLGNGVDESLVLGAHVGAWLTQILNGAARLVERGLNRAGQGLAAIA